ncbi:hypothetical protein PCASD_07765 [Puccinia coronata f. sp. avenae]|uniref:Uncharacterized protein n=1 Tax=Puccinia coronata f. sp. avenae TaxID=200324 RepID=A0A2N5US72_9BASI|nr:hypothetical protein PCASD_07765 [Puccinia coronata f. sp. avenae]
MSAKIPPAGTIYPKVKPTSPASKFSGHPTLKTGTIEHLKPPGVIYLLDPNQAKSDLGASPIIQGYSFDTSGIYLPTSSHSCTSVLSTVDNLAVCSVIAKTIHHANIRYVQQFNTNA